LRERASGSSVRAAQAEIAEPGAGLDLVELREPEFYSEDADLVQQQAVCLFCLIAPGTATGIPVAPPVACLALRWRL
jgi:hypothetical protein